MDWQQIVSLVIVAVTFVLLFRSEVRRRRRARMRACGHDCGCSSRILEQIKAEAARNATGTTRISV